MERITQQLTFVRTFAIALVLVVAIFGVPLVGAQKVDGDSSSDSGRTVIKADKPSDSGGGDTKPSSGGASDRGDTKSTSGSTSGSGTQSTPTGVETCPNGGIWNDIRDENGNCFDGGGPANTNITLIAGDRAFVTVRNISPTQSYLIHLASYEAPLPISHPDYIEAQTLFQRRTSNMAPGMELTFSVPVPECGNYQVDLFAGPNVPQSNPDFGAPPLSLTHTLFDWTAEHQGQPCVPECPVPAPIISTSGSASGTVGVPFSHDITIIGAVYPAGVMTEGVLPAGLTFARVSGNLYRISGTPTEQTSTQFVVSASNQCGFVSQPITITIGGGSCPVPPPFITSPTVASGIVGQPFSYSITTAGGPAAISAEQLPAWLTFNPLMNTLTGTPTHEGVFPAVITASNECGSASITVLITVTGSQCPIDPPVITSPTEIRGTVGSRITYEIEFIGKGRLNVTNLPEWLEYQQPGTLTGIPTEAGVYDVIIVVGNSCGQDEITLRIIISDNSCPIDPPVITSPTQITGVVGQQLVYTVEITGIGRLHITNLPNWLEHQQPNTLIGTPTQPGTFDVTIVAGNSCGQHEITLRIIITGGGDDDDDDDDDGCVGRCGGGGGGPRRPSVVLFSEPEVLGASISLAQLPYTGFGTSVIQLALFILGLLAISGGIIYMIMRRFGDTGGTTVYTTPTDSPRTPVAPAAPAVVETEDALSPEVYEEYVRATTVAPVAAPRVAQARAEEYVPAHVPTAPAVERHAPQMAAASAPALRREQAPAAREEVSTARIQTEARSARALISDDGAELIAKSSEGDEEKAIERMQQIVDIAKTRYPREDGWLILDKDRVRETLFISTLSMVPLFVEWIVRCEDKKVFTFLRMLKHQEQPVADFMRKVVSELDSAHRARMEGADAQAKANAHVAEVTYHLSNKDFESLVNELLHGVDERYDSAYTSVRLALVRAIDMLKERSLRMAGAPYGSHATNS